MDTESTKKKVDRRDYHPRKMKCGPNIWMAKNLCEKQYHGGKKIGANALSKKNRGGTPGGAGKNRRLINAKRPHRPPRLRNCGGWKRSIDSLKDTNKGRGGGPITRTYKKKGKGK